MTIHELRKNGCKVRVHHYRRPISFVKRDKKSNILLPAKSSESLEWVHAKGGRTVIEITDQTGKTQRGETICSIKENYNKKVGVSVALGRALKKF